MLIKRVPAFAVIRAAVSLVYLVFAFMLIYTGWNLVGVLSAVLLAIS